MSDADSRPGDGAPYAHPRRSLVRVNAIANYVGRGWATIIGLLCLPLFLSLLGREAYGLIGAFAVVQAWALLLDFGLTPTLNREIARTRAGNRSWQSLADLIRTIELLAIVLATVIAGAVYLAAPTLATSWLEPRQLTSQTVADAIAVMGVLAAVRWIEQVYRGAIQGSEDQVWLNLVQAGTETARWGGALAILHTVDANVLLFFGWNLIVSMLSVLLMKRRVTAFLRRHTQVAARPNIRELGAVRGFAGGMFLSSILTFLLTQADKLIVGKYVPLAEFGIYALVGTAAAGLLQLVQPMNVAILPRFTALYEEARRAELTIAFQTASQWLSLIVLPIGLLIVILPEPALMAWTGDRAVVTSGSTILSLLMLASLMNAMANIPYMLQLSHGWTSLTNQLNAAAIVLLLPIMIWATKAYGGVGAAAVLASLNLISMTVISSLVISRLLPGQLVFWFARSVLVPVMSGGLIAALLRLCLPTPQDRATAVMQIGLCGIAVMAPILACLPYPRKALTGYLNRRTG